MKKVTDKYTDYVFCWKSNGVYNSKLKPLYTAFLNSIKLTGYKIGTKFNKDALAIEQNNYLTKIVNVYIVYDLAAWPRKPTNNFKFKDCFFGSINIVKNSDKEKYMYSGYGITFDSGVSWSFDNGTARTVMKKSSINFTNSSKKFYLSLHYNDDNS